MKTRVPRTELARLLFTTRDFLRPMLPANEFPIATDAPPWLHEEGARCFLLADQIIDFFEPLLRESLADAIVTFHEDRFSWIANANAPEGIVAAFEAVADFAERWIEFDHATDHDPVVKYIQLLAVEIQKQLVAKLRQDIPDAATKARIQAFRLQTEQEGGAQN